MKVVNIVHTAHEQTQFRPTIRSANPFVIRDTARQPNLRQIVPQKDNLVRLRRR